MQRHLIGGIQCHPLGLGLIAGIDGYQTIAIIRRNTRVMSDAACPGGLEQQKKMGSGAS